MIMSETIKKTVYSLYKDGNLLPESERTEITEKAVFFPEEVAVGKISVSRSLPIKLYKFGGNASASVHISVPYVVAEGELEEALAYANNVCDTEILRQLQQYTQHLDSMNVDWKKVEDNIGE